jgi:hypothetical protein
MKMKLCANNHYYDADANDSCPYCKGSGAIGVTVAAAAPQPYTAPAAADGDGKTVPVFGAPAQSGGGDGRTVPIFRKQAEERGDADVAIDPVVAWLVCIEGADKGRDYRVRDGNNFVGRGDNMDICVRNDDTISRENHAIVTYDSRDKLYYFAPGSGRNIVRLNGKPVLTVSELHAYDRVEIGASIFVFVPLCGGAFSWA